MISRLYDFSPNGSLLPNPVDDELSQLVDEVNRKLDSTGGTVVDLLCAGAFAGSRESFLLTGGGGGVYPSSSTYYRYDGGTTTSELAFTMLRAGSVVGFSVQARCTSFVSNHVFTPRVRKNGSNVLALSDITINSTGFFPMYSSFARGTYTFSAGDRLSYYHDVVTAGSASGAPWVLLEIQTDT